MLNQAETRDLTEFGYNEPTSPGLPSHNTKEKSRALQQVFLQSRNLFLITTDQ